MNPWRGRFGGLAHATLLATATLALSVGAVALFGSLSRAAPTSPPDWVLVGRSAHGQVLFSVPLVDGSFALRYRNSVYGSLAEERFNVDPSGRLVLVELAAEEMALLGEYYEVAGPPQAAPPGDALRWTASPAAATQLTELNVAATSLGRRTLVVEGHSHLALWQLVPPGEVTVLLSAERSP